MRFKMQQKFFTLTDAFTIEDDAGNPAYTVRGRFFSIGDNLTLSDTAGNEVARIEQKLFAWGPTYNIYRDGMLLATVKKHIFTFLRCQFTVDVPGPDDLEATGDLMDMEYTFTRNGRAVATVSKAWFSFTNSYGIDIADDQDPVLILASAIVIDMVCHEKHHDKNVMENVAEAGLLGELFDTETHHAETGCDSDTDAGTAIAGGAIAGGTIAGGADAGAASTSSSGDGILAVFGKLFSGHENNHSPSTPPPDPDTTPVEADDRPSNDHQTSGGFFSSLFGSGDPDSSDTSSDSGSSFSDSGSSFSDSGSSSSD